VGAATASPRPHDERGHQLRRQKKTPAGCQSAGVCRGNLPLLAFVRDEWRGVERQKARWFWRRAEGLIPEIRFAIWKQKAHDPRASRGRAQSPRDFNSRPAPEKATADLYQRSDACFSQMKWFRPSRSPRWLDAGKTFGRMFREAEIGNHQRNAIALLPTALPASRQKAPSFTAKISSPVSEPSDPASGSEGSVQLFALSFPVRVLGSSWPALTPHEG
jgi:hypothetical protein